MSWFGSAASIDDKVEQATSESLPSGSQDLGLNLEICDLIRSKTVPPKDAMRSLKRRLLHKNPNVQIATLHLIDIAIKNGGSHFINEIASREFMDTFTLVLKPLNGTVNPDVKLLMLELLQNWVGAFEGQMQLAYFNKVYTNLKSEGFEFPTASTKINSSFFDTSAPPEWVDSDTCMKSGTPFSFVNRKHHCRNCGGVYIQQYCNNYIALPHYGINDPVRVCDDCFEKLTGKKKDDSTDSSSAPTHAPIAAAAITTTSNGTSQEDDDLQRAIKLSLQDAGQNAAPPATFTAPQIATTEDDDEDDEMKAAIAASLAEMNSQTSPPPAQQQSSLFANNLYQLPPVGSCAPASSLPYNNTGSSEFADQGASAIPQLSHQPSGGFIPEIDDFSALEEEAINRYVQLVDSMEQAPPGTILQNTQLQQLNEKVGTLRPKLVKGLRGTIDKYEKLEDMHGKLTAVVRLYDRLLEDRLASTYRGSSYGQYTASAPPAQQQQYYYPSAPPSAPAGSAVNNYSHPPDGIARNFTGQSAYSTQSQFESNYPPYTPQPQAPQVDQEQHKQPEPKEEPVLIEL